MTAGKYAPVSIDGLESGEDRVINHFFHDFKGELSTVIMCLEALRGGAGGAVNGAQDRWLGRAVRNCQHMVELVNDYRDACLMEEGGFARAPEAVDLAASFDGLRALAAPIATERGLALTVALDGPAAPAVFSAPLFRRMLEGLVLRVLDNTRKGGEVAVAGRAAGGRLELEVAWDGVEVDAALAETVFDKQRQAETGLLIGRGYTLLFCRAAAVYMGGTLSLHPRPGRGNRVAVRVPYGAPGGGAR